RIRNLHEIHTMEQVRQTYTDMFKSIISLDNSDHTKSLIDKIVSILPKYHGGEFLSSIQSEMGVRPVLVNGDMHVGNVLIDVESGNLLALIDWQCTHLGVGVEDLHRIALSALTTNQRRESFPLLVEEMYNSLVENLVGADPPYSLDTMLLLSDLIFPFCGILFAATLTISAEHAMIQENDASITVEEKTRRKAVETDKLIGCLEDIVDFEIKNKKHSDIQKFRDP
ncbi:hypothetical protein PENTCL1PPCAC_25364, partial [Pristionchus entomophagus]